VARLTQPARPAPGNALPRYPEAAREDGLEGTVRLLVDIASDGTVKAVRWAIRSGVPLLDQAARDAGRLWRFLPAWHDGVAVAAVVPVTLQFRLHGDTVWLAQAGGATP
jgi:protein TonB